MKAWELSVVAVEPTSSERTEHRFRVECDEDSLRRFIGFCGLRLCSVQAEAAPAGDEVPLVSLEQDASDLRYASLEIHTLPLEARQLEFLRVDGHWFVKTSEGVQEAIENAWRTGFQDRPCEHRNITVGEGEGHCNNCGAALDFDPGSRNWVEKGGVE